MRSGSADRSRTSRRMRSSYWPRNDVPASSATWSSARMRASLSAGGTSPAAMRCARPSTIAVFLKPALVRGDIRVVGATTGSEYDKWIRGDPALERRFQPVLVEELDAIQTWEVLVARRPRLERHHAVAITDDALKAAIVLTDRFVPERARPDKAIDVLDEACAHAQATAHVSPELDKLIRDRKKVEAMIRRGLTEEQGSAPEEPMPDLATVLQRFGEELNELLGGEGRRKTPEEEPPPTSGDLRRPSALEQQRAELDRRLRAELERQGMVVTGKEGARVVGVAGGQRGPWGRSPPPPPLPAVPC